MMITKTERNPKLEAQLARHLDGWTIYAFQRVGSTTEIAHQLAADGATEGTLVWAAQQTQGRGRLGRVWESPGGGAYFSLILHPSRPPHEIPQLSLIAGLAAAEAIKELSGLFPSIRWPNDILLDGLKVVGILTELSTQHLAHPATMLGGSANLFGGSTQTYAVVGIGINVLTHVEELPKGATSLAAAGAVSVDPYRLTGELCRRFRAWYDVWTAQGFAPAREALRPWIGLFGQPVHISAGTDRFEGTASDLDEAGRLVVRLDSGVLRAFDMGEVTLLR